MKPSIKIVCWVFSFLMIATSCESFLEEKPQTFLSPDFYFTSESQVNAAVNGVYTFLDDCFSGDIEMGSQTYLFFEYLPGYADRPYSSSSTSIGQAINLNVKEDNTYLEKIWETNYKAIENCNSVLEGLVKVTPEIMKTENKNIRWGEVCFLRAYSYFNLVRLFGDVPLKLSSTKNLSSTKVELTASKDVYAQIEKDLNTADSLMVNNAWVSMEGRVSRGAVKALMAKVYLTMAGYPLQKGTEYYQKAYEQAKALVESGKYTLFDTYAAMRDVANENSGENIWMIQREKQYASSPVHFNLLPYPEPSRPISANGTGGGALAPAIAFYKSYAADDKRIEEQAYYYTKHAALDDANTTVDLGRPYLYKFWDDAAAKSGQSGKNYPLFTYPDVLLMMAEAKVQADGGSTSDAAAIDAYYKIRHRALPLEAKPTQLAIEQVLKERFWEICFQGQTWFDMLRTRKAFNVTTGKIIDILGYNAPSHPEGMVFGEEDLLFPYPLREKRLNPNLVR